MQWGRALPGLWVAGKWVTFAEGSPHQHRRAGATAACLGELHAVPAGSQVALLTPPPRGHSPATHGPLLRGLVCHAQPTHSSTPGQVSNNDLGDRVLCHVARDYPQNRGLRVGLGEPQALKLFVNCCGEESSLISVCIILTF